MILLETPTAADAAELAQVARAAFGETFAHLYSPEDYQAFLEEAFGEGGLPAQIDDPAYRIRVHRDPDGRITSWIKLGPRALPVDDPMPGAIELRQLYILQAWQGSGVAQAMMDWAIASAREEGASALYLTVYVDNVRAQRFYARYGFVEVGKYRFKVGEQYDDDRIWMLKL